MEIIANKLYYIYIIIKKSLIIKKINKKLMNSNVIWIDANIIDNKENISYVKELKSIG